jgi:hypothetical protein
MLTALLLLGALFWVLMYFRMGRTMLVVGCFLFSLVILSLGTLLGCFLQMFIEQQAMRKWDGHLTFMTTALIDSSFFELWMIPFVLVIAVVDVLWLNIQLVIIHPTVGTFLGGTLGGWGAVRVWYYGFKSFNQAYALHTGKTFTGKPFTGKSAHEEQQNDFLRHFQAQIDREKNDPMKVKQRERQRLIDMGIHPGKD